MGRPAGARVPRLDGVQLRRGEAVVHLSGSRMRPEGGNPVRAGTLLSVPSLLRSGLRESAGERDAPCPSPGAGDPGEARWACEHDGAVPREAKGDALEDVRAALVGAPRGGYGAASGYEEVARSLREAGRIASVEGVRSAVLGTRPLRTRRRSSLGRCLGSFADFRT